jgi:hypothetical protein
MVGEFHDGQGLFPEPPNRSAGFAILRQISELVIDNPITPFLIVDVNTQISHLIQTIVISGERIKPILRLFYKTGFNRLI